MVLKRIGPFSAAKLSGVLYAFIGLIGGLIMALFSMVMPSGWGQGMGSMMGGGFGLAAVIVLPLLYGALGFIFGGISAAVFNVAAGMMGGLELDLE